MINQTIRQPIYLCIAISCFLLSGFYTNAQVDKPAILSSGCGTQLYLKDQYEIKYDLFEHSLLQKRQQLLLPGTERSNTTYTLPVVFHVVHQNGPENVPETAIRQTLSMLNDAFANRNDFQRADGVDINIRFCVAQKAPDGSNRLGITRHFSPMTNMVEELDDNNLKAIELWDPLTYINIWIVRDITSLSSGPGVAAYATLPNTHGALFDGIVAEAGFLGGDADATKVLIHEMGHYLGLYHTFEGGCKNDNCLTDGDKVCDTPPDASTTPLACNVTVNSCTTDENDHSINNPFRPIASGGSGDQPDMTRNYMDYGYPQCHDKFTEGQRQRMRDALEITRSSLLLHTTICAECNMPIIASINVTDTVQAGVPIVFSLSLNTTAVTVNWNIDGQVYNNQPTVTITFSQQKNITVTVTIANSDPGCFTQLSKNIFVVCGANPQFTVTPDGLVSPGETIHLASTAAGTLTWKIDGVVVGTGASFDYAVPDTKGRLLTLTADNGICFAESEPYFIQPGNCSDSKENNTWYFGDGAGIDFNQKPARAIPGKIFTLEGCAVICNENGSPLFHSNGEYVRNSNSGSTLLNGAGLTGNSTTTQSALFVPKPGDDRYIYLFTLTYEAGYFTPANRGLSYSVIDRQGDAGKGAVIQKNIPVFEVASEQLTAVKNKTGTGVWVIAHEWNSNAFYAFLVSDTGICQTPVISHVGTVHQAPSANPLQFALGELKSSPSGNKLAIAKTGDGYCEVFDFDNASGRISNAIQLENNYTENVYGVAFSPDEHYLYLASGNGLPFRLIRFDITAGNEAAINNSVQLLHESLTDEAGSLQLAPDGKIYVARVFQKFVGVIENPNAVQPADCRFTDKGLFLSPGTQSAAGLPNSVQSSYISVKPVIYGPAKICRTGLTDTLVKYYFIRKGRATYSWSHTGINTIEATTDSTLTLRIGNMGNDTLVLQRSASCIDMYDTLYISSGTVTAASIGNDITVCKGTPVTFTATPGFAGYIWSNDEITPSVTINTEGYVWVDAINQSGCVYRDSVLVTYYKLPQLNLGRDTAICNSGSIILTAPPGMDSYAWNTGASTENITVSDSGIYRVTVGKFGCLFRDTIYIGKNIPDYLFAQDTIIGCQSTRLTVPPGYTSYLWTLPDGRDTVAEKLYVMIRGMYHLTWSNACGTRVDSIFINIPKIVYSDSLQTCADSLFVTAAYPVMSIFNTVYGPGAYCSLAANKLDITIIKTGDYGIMARYPVASGPTCFIIQEVHVVVDSAFTRPPMSLNIGNDTSICQGAIVPLAVPGGFDSYWWNTGSRDSFTTVFVPGLYYVDAKYCGYTYTDSVKIITDHSLQLNLGNDTTICGNSPIVLDAGTSFNWYSWSSGQTTSSIPVQTPGTYIAFAGKNNCISSDTIIVTSEFITPSISFTPDSVCAGELITAQIAPVAGTQITWEDGSTASTRTFTAPYTSVLTINGQNCTQAIQVTTPVKPAGSCNTSGNPDCAVLFRVRPNPGNNHVALFSDCPGIAGTQLAMRVLCIDRKEVLKMQGNIDACNAALNKLMPLLASGVYIIDVGCPVCSKLKQSIKWMIAR